MKMTVNQMIARQNKIRAILQFSSGKNSELYQELGQLEAKITSFETQREAKNSVKLVEEIRNLKSCVGENFQSSFKSNESYYLSEIEGISHIQQNGDFEILVIVTRPSGYLIPRKVTINGIDYAITAEESKNYLERIDY